MESLSNFIFEQVVDKELEEAKHEKWYKYEYKFRYEQGKNTLLHYVFARNKYEAEDLAIKACQNKRTQYNGFFGLTGVKIPVVVGKDIKIIRYPDPKRSSIYATYM